MFKRLPAFTLIEVLVVATIIIVLASISIGSFAGASKSARDAKRKSDLETIKQALVLYKTQIGSYPTDVSSLTGAVNYISPPFPVDPVGGGTYQVDLDTDSFCFCATMDSPKGNKATLNCTTNDWVANSSGTHYCVQQPY